MEASATTTTSAVQPRRLELSLNPNDGSLLTTPLTNVLLATTDGLYSDLASMVRGELDVVTVATAGGTDGDRGDRDDGGGGGGVELSSVTAAAAVAASSSAMGATTKKKERMSNLSFAARRHELSWRLAMHGRALQHVAALTAAHHSGISTVTAGSTASAVPAVKSDFANAVSVSSKALQHARTAWVQADEAQDALYFFHAQLFPARAAPHDVYGAADVLLQGQWYDLPYDILLRTDRYASSPIATASAREIQQAWCLATQEKLVTGEVGYYVQQQQQQQHGTDDSASVLYEKPLWKVTCRGGLVKLTHGQPRTKVDHGRQMGDNQAEPKQQRDEEEYPITALLTVFPAATPRWTLLSLEVKVQAKTGEFQHQLETSNRQRYQLHRLAANAMTREEAAAVLAAASITASEAKPAVTVTALAPPPARPLQALFQVAHVFSLSWQLEVLSAQALALRRGVWGAAAASSSTGGTIMAASTLIGITATADASILQVTPVQFFASSTDDGNKAAAAAAIPAAKQQHPSGVAAAAPDEDVLGVVSISFWKVDDAYGPPSMGDIALLEDVDGDKPDDTHSSSRTATGRGGQKRYSTFTNQLSLTIRAVRNVGMKVSLSGAATVMKALQDASLSSRSNSASVRRVCSTRDVEHGIRQRQRMEATVHNLLEAASNPFCLSASDALLAATQLCAECKCYAAVRALQSSSASAGAGTTTSAARLPDWMRLAVDHGSVIVAAHIQYHGLDHKESTASGNDRTKKAILFRLTCDVRTGGFVCAFSRSMMLIRRLASNQLFHQQQASEAMALNIASLPQNRQRRAMAGGMSEGGGSSGVLNVSSARVVRDAFQGLVRSMNVLGQRTGVSGSGDGFETSCDWDNLEGARSILLRERASQSACLDVRTSLIQCCGMAALYGVTALSMSGAWGIDAMPDIAGRELFNSMDGIRLHPAPPLSILLDQEIVETSVTTSDGVSKKSSNVDQFLFSVACSVNQERLLLVPLSIQVKRDSPSSVPTRKGCQVMKFRGPSSSIGSYPLFPDRLGEPPLKRVKTASIDDDQDTSTDDIIDLIDEVGPFAEILEATITHTL